MKHAISVTSLLGALLAPALTSCGSKSESKPQPVIVYGKMTVETTTGTDAGTFELTALTSCKRNADTGRVDVSISQGVDSEVLHLRSVPRQSEFHDRPGWEI
jgi:hypothetical protein